ncbi:MAG: hypothetical protein D3907_08170 [Candidatus Electrothrix sp. AUS3]|nr:hypothetical protein [Candidatus Electrothrix gigas]
MIEQPKTVVDKIPPATFWIGVILVVAGVISLLGLAAIIVQIIIDPEGVALMQWLTEKVSPKGFYFQGYVAKTPFQFNVSSALQYIFLGIIGLVIVNIFAALVGKFITVGAELIQFAGIQKTEQPVRKKEAE